MRFFLVTTRGLEDVARAEAIERLPGARLVEEGYRRVVLEAPAAAAGALLALRCTDDAFVAVAGWAGIGKTRAALARLSDLAAAVDLGPALELCARLRPVARPPCFAASASFVGRRNYTSPEMKLALAAGVARRHGWAYIDAEADDALSLRLFIEHERALLGVRLAARPLHRRPYKLASLPGSLKPPVAACLLRLAGLAHGDFCVDPCCGAGTIVIEAALAGAQALGGDSSPAALALAASNLRASGAAPGRLGAGSAELRRWDARALPLAEASVDCVASNLPFGQQVPADGDLGELYVALARELARVLRPGGRAALLTSQVELLADAVARAGALRIRERRAISLHGQNPEIFVVEA